MSTPVARRYSLSRSRSLKAHPEVYDALVIGVPDERWGSRVSAVIQPRPGTRPSTASIQEHVRKHLAGFKVPRSIVLVDQMPRHVTGKETILWPNRSCSSPWRAESHQMLKAH